MPGLGAPVIDLAFSPVAAGHWEIFAVDEYETIHFSSWRDSGGILPGWSQWTAMPAPEGLPVTSVSAGCASLRDQDHGRVAGHRQDLVTVADGQVWHRQRRGVPDAMAAWSDWGP